METGKLWVVFSPVFKNEVEVPGMIGLYPIFDREDYARIWAKIEEENSGDEITVEEIEFDLEEEDELTDDGAKLFCEHHFSTN